ncbi:MAG: hypothetical protein U9M90_01600 [Patescibacteria group bacterium]|nr:hypothetical protein [Patescibacteria group bacterium]
MKKINLKSSEMAASRRKSISGSTSLMISVLLLIMSMGIYGVVMYLDVSTAKKISFTKEEISAIKKKMDTKETQDVYDFQGRLFDIEDLISGRAKQSENLEKISIHTLPETRFAKVAEKVGDDGKTEIEAIIIIQDHYTLSQQLEAYSLMDEAENIMLKNSKQEDGAVEAKLTFRIK